MQHVFDLSEATAILTRTPGALRSLLADLPEAWLQVNEGPDTWTARDVLAHLADLEDMDWIVRARIILEHGDARPFEPVNREAFRSRFAGMHITDLLALFEQRRARNLASLDDMNVSEEKLDLPGLHPALGGVTLRQLLATWVVHDLTHVAQIVRVLASRYHDEVGPWKEYLSILKP
jgi:hypothetical protein